MPKLPKSKGAMAALVAGVAVLAAMAALIVMSTVIHPNVHAVRMHVETPNSDGTTPTLVNFHALDEGHKDHTYATTGEDNTFYVEPGDYEVRFIPTVNADRTSYKDYRLSYTVVDGDNADISCRLDPDNAPLSRVELTHLYNKVIQLEPTAASTDLRGVGTYVKNVGNLIVAD